MSSTPASNRGASSVDDRTDLAKIRTDLAFQRTKMAADRTTMAYLRTSISLIGFGFTIYKFFQYMKDAPELDAFGTLGGRLLGMSLLTLGAIMLALSVFQQIVYLRRLAEEEGAKPKLSIALAGSMAMLAIGVLALMNIIFAAGPI